MEAWENSDYCVKEAVFRHDLLICFGKFKYALESFYMLWKVLNMLWKVLYALKSSICFGKFYMFLKILYVFASFV